MELPIFLGSNGKGKILTPNIDFVTSKTFLKSLSSFISSTLDIGSSDE